MHNRAKVPETPFPNHYIDKGPVHFSKLLKPFAFTIMVSNRKQSIYVKASAHIHTYSNMLQLLVALQSFMKWHPNRGLLTVWGRILIDPCIAVKHFLLHGSNANLLMSQLVSWNLRLNCRSRNVSACVEAFTLLLRQKWIKISLCIKDTTVLA